MHLRLIYLLLALRSCQNAQRIPKNGVFISCVPEKDIVEQVVYHQDTLSLHYRAVELENNEFDTIFLDICKKFTFDAHPFLRYDVQYFFDENKRRVAKNLIYTSCKSKLDTISIAKNEKKVLFIDMPDFDLKVDSTVAIWGF